MNKLIFGSILSILLSSPLSASAQTNERYVRKALPTPEFFVPKQALPPQKEKLPPFNIPQRRVERPVVLQEPDDAIETITFSQEEADSAPTVSKNESPEFNPNLDISIPEVSSDFSNNVPPKYQQEYDAYLKDLQVIAETGQAPHNPELEEDIQKMNSDARFSVDEDGNFSQEPDAPQSSEPLAFNNIYSDTQTILAANTQILETVEIIRYPKGYKPQSKVKEVEREEPPVKKTEEVLLPKEATFSEQSRSLPQETNEYEALSPEAAAYFAGTNHFYGDSVPADEEELEQPKKKKKSEKKSKKIRPAKKRIFIDEDADDQEDVKEEEKFPRAYSTPNIVKPTRKTSRSSGSRSRSSSSSNRGNSSSGSHGSSGSFGLGPNMVR